MKHRLLILLWRIFPLNSVKLITGRDYIDSKVNVDGKHFNNCTFTHCELVYHAMGAVAMHRCHFDSCRWTFMGPAGTTIKMLRTMQHGGFDTVVGELMEMIKSEE